MKNKKIIGVSPKPSASISELAEYREKCQAAINEGNKRTAVVRSKTIPAVRIYPSEVGGLKLGRWRK